MTVDQSLKKKKKDVFVNWLKRKQLSFQHVINIKIVNEMFYILFSGTKPSKSNVHFTHSAHLNSDLPECFIPCFLLVDIFTQFPNAEHLLAFK